MGVTAVRDDDGEAVPEGIDLAPVDGLLETATGRTVARRGRVWSFRGRPAAFCGACVETARGEGVGLGPWSARPLDPGESVVCARCGGAIR